MARIREHHPTIIATDGSLRAGPRANIVMAASVVFTKPVLYEPDEPRFEVDDILWDRSEEEETWEEGEHPGNDGDSNESLESAMRKREDTVPPHAYPVNGISHYVLNFPKTTPTKYLSVTQRLSSASTILSAELLAIKNGLLLLIQNLDYLRPHPICIVSDSKSGLERLKRGPLSTDPTDPIETLIWGLLLHLANCDFRVTLAFVYSHVGGAPENHIADELAGTLIPDLPEMSLASEKDMRSYISIKVREEYEKNTKLEHHGIRAALVGHRPTRNSDTCSITGEYIDRSQQVILTRARTGNCTTHGDQYHKLRGTKNTCRFCTKQDAPPPSGEQPTTNTPTPKHYRQSYQCPHCEKVLTTLLTLRNHVKGEHGVEPPPETGTKCPICAKDFPTVRSKGVHEGHCRKKHGYVQHGPEPNPETLPQEADEETLPQDNVLHALTCPAIQPLRDKHMVENLWQEHGANYFFSIAFLEFVQDLYHGGKHDETTTATSDA